MLARVHESKSFNPTLVNIKVKHGKRCLGKMDFFPKSEKKLILACSATFHTFLYCWISVVKLRSWNAKPIKLQCSDLGVSNVSVFNINLTKTDDVNGIIDMGKTPLLVIKQVLIVMLAVGNGLSFYIMMSGAAGWTVRGAHLHHALGTSQVQASGPDSCLLRNPDSNHISRALEAHLDHVEPRPLKGGARSLKP